MGEGVVRALCDAGAGDVVIVNRTFAVAADLAARLGGRAIALDDLTAELRRVDLLVSSTGASTLMVESNDLAAVMRSRAQRPLLVVDIAVPRDIDPQARDIAGVTLLDMDDLRDYADAGMRERQREVTAVERIVDEELERYQAYATSREVAPLIAALFQRADDIRHAEIERFAAKLASLDPRRARRGRSARAGHHRQTALPADRAPQRRGGHGAWRTARRRTARPLRSVTRLRVATRGSALALWQANHIIGLLRAFDMALEPELVLVETTADRRLDLAIADLGGKGAFVKDVQLAVLEGRADIAVHSAKDLPAETPAGLRIAAVPQRADPRDVLVGARLDELPQGAHIATGSQRRQAQLAALRPDLRFEGLRGNIGTRLTKAQDYDAIVMAKAALDRLAADLVTAGTMPAVVDVLDPTSMTPQVGQGALAVECRAGDRATLRRIRPLEHPPTRRAVDAERAFLAELGGDCDLPAGAFATIIGDSGHRVAIAAVLLRDGELRRAQVVGVDPQRAGRLAARAVVRGAIDEPAADRSSPGGGTTP